MNRIIKFRGKSIETGEWIKGQLEEFDDGSARIVTYSERVLESVLDGQTRHHVIRDAVDVRPDTTGQLLGIEDKNGTEIYEGDYCKSNYYQFGELIEGVVEYNHTGQYVLALGSFKFPIHDLVYNSWTLEIISNIYDNPEKEGQRA